MSKHFSGLHSQQFPPPGVYIVSFRSTSVLQIKIQRVLISPANPAQVSTGRGPPCSESQGFNSLPSNPALPQATGSGFFTVPATNGVQARPTQGRQCFQVLGTMLQMVKPVHFPCHFPLNPLTVGAVKTLISLYLSPGTFSINHQLNYPLCHPGICSSNETPVSIFC